MSELRTIEIPKRVRKKKKKSKSGAQTKKLSDKHYHRLQRYAINIGVDPSGTIKTLLKRIYHRARAMAYEGKKVPDMDLKSYPQTIQNYVGYLVDTTKRQTEKTSKKRKKRIKKEEPREKEHDPERQTLIDTSAMEQKINDIELSEDEKGVESIDEKPTEPIPDGRTVPHSVTAGPFTFLHDQFANLTRDKHLEMMKKYQEQINVLGLGTSEAEQNIKELQSAIGPWGGQMMWQRSLMPDDYEYHGQDRMRAEVLGLEKDTVRRKGPKVKKGSVPLSRSMASIDPNYRNFDPRYTRLPRIIFYLCLLILLSLILFGVEWLSSNLFIQPGERLMTETNKSQAILDQIRAPFGAWGDRNTLRRPRRSDNRSTMDMMRPTDMSGEKMRLV